MIITRKGTLILQKRVRYFGLLFLGDGATISRNPLLNILVSGGGKLPVAVLEIVDFQGHLADGGKMMEPLYVLELLST